MPKKLEITGLAQETDFADPERTRTVLVVNNGALRLRVDEDAVQDLLKYALEGFQTEELDTSTSTSISNGYNEEKDEEEVVPDDEEQTDEAGISQI